MSGLVAARVERLAREIGCTRADIASALEVSATSLHEYAADRRELPEWVALRLSIAESAAGLDPIVPNVVCLRQMADHIERVARDVVGKVNGLKRAGEARRRGRRAR